MSERSGMSDIADRALVIAALVLIVTYVVLAVVLVLTVHGS
jgi:hypothetical protein